MAIAQDLGTLKTLEQGLVANKVAPFAYTQTAYDNNTVAGVTDFDPERAMNVPQGTAVVMQVNQTILDKGWRAQASALTRMLMNHFLGRLSYNVNKVHDNILSLITSLEGALGGANGIATLNASGKLPVAQYPVTVNGESPDASGAITVKADGINTQSLVTPDPTQGGATTQNLEKILTYLVNMVS